MFRIPHIQVVILLLWLPDCAQQATREARVAQKVSLPPAVTLSPEPGRLAEDVPSVEREASAERTRDELEPTGETVVPVDFHTPVIQEKLAAMKASHPFPDDESYLESIDVESLELERQQEGQLSLEELESTVLARHPAIGEAEANVAALRGTWLQVGLKPNPVAQYNGEEIGNGGSAGLHIAAVGQTIVTANKLSLRRQVVAAQIEQAQADLDTMRYRVLSDLRAEFQNALVAQERLALSKQILNIANESLKSVEAMNRASEASRIELLQAQTVYQQAQTSVEAAEAQLHSARQRLAAVAGIEQLPAQSLDGEIGIVLEDTDYEQLAREVLASSPQIASRAAEIVRAQRALRLACASITPNVTAQFGVGVDTGSDDTFGAVQISVPLPITNRNQGTIRQTRAEIAAADRALRRTELELQWRLAQALQAYEVGRVRQNRIREEVVPRAEEMLTLSIQAFEAGESSYMQLLTVQRTLFEARLSLLNATASATQAANLIDNYLLRGILPQ